MKLKTTLIIKRNFITTQYLLYFISYNIAIVCLRKSNFHHNQSFCFEDFPRILAFLYRLTNRTRCRRLSSRSFDIITIIIHVHPKSRGGYLHDGPIHTPGTRLRAKKFYHLNRFYARIWL